MTNKTTDTRTIRLPVAALRQVEVVAAESGQTPTALLRNVVVDWLQKYKARTLTDQEAGLSFSQN